MLVTIALAALLGTASLCDKVCDPDPVCQAVCGTPDRKQAMAACEAQLASNTKEMNELQFITGQCAERLWRCETKPACSAKKPAKKIGKKTSTKVVVKPQENVKQEQKQEQSQQVIVNVIVNQDRQKDRQVERPKERPAKPFPLGIGARGAVGLMACDPPVFGLVGVRGRLLPAHLGLELNTQFAYGHSAQLMVYPVQGPIAWHLDFGALLFMRDGAQVNLLGGTGVEVQVVPHFSITADWRVTFPKNADLGNQLLRSQLMLGLMLHTW